MSKIKKHILDNGLKIIYSKDTNTEMVALNLLYQVGARDENPNQTGFAHLFEHLMFGGSLHIPEYDKPLQNAGGENNAWTNNDITNFYLTIPKENVETGFRLESDRMLSLSFSPQSLETQKQVVCEEFKERNLNQPYGDSMLLFRPLAYKVHPYQWSTIGKELSHIENVTMADVKDFFFKWYAPNNAILAVTGNIEFEEVVRLSEKWFAPIEKRNVALRNLPKEPKQTEARFLEVERDVPLHSIIKGYHMCDHYHEDYYTFDAISDLLSNGNSSRMFQTLVNEKQLFADVNAYISGDIDDGLFYVTGKPLPGLSIEEADGLLTEEVQKLITTEISDYELEKVKNKYEANAVYSRMNYLNRATEMAYFEMLSKAEDMYLEVDHYRSVTKDSIRRVVAETFVPSNCSTLYYCSSQLNSK